MNIVNISTQIRAINEQLSSKLRGIGSISIFSIPTTHIYPANLSRPVNFKSR